MPAARRGQRASDPTAAPAVPTADPGSASLPDAASATPNPANRPGRRPAPSDRTGDRGRGARPARQPEIGRRRLVDTPGPDPSTPLAETRLVVGRVIGTHGVRGELKVAIVTDDPEHLATLKRVWLGIEPRPRKLLGIRFHAGNALIRLSGIATPEAVREHRGQALWMAGTDARPLGPGEYRLYQLVGLEAVTEDGTSLGRVADVMETGAHDVFVVSPVAGGPDILLPYHPDVILDVRPDEGRMLVRPLVYWEDAPVAAPERATERGGADSPADR